MSKRATLLLIAIFTASSLIMVESAFAQSIPKPSVPEFTLKFVDSSYNVTETDPYTGAKVVQPIVNRTIEVIIKNQPFTPYTDADGNRIWLFYSIRFKGYSEDWGFYNESSFDGFQNYLLMSDSEYTVRSYSIQEISTADLSVTPYVIGEIPPGGQVDFQVQAIVGYTTRVYGTPVPPWTESYRDVFTGETSGWSSTQTITIPAEIPEFPSGIILPLLVIVLISGRSSGSLQETQALSREMFVHFRFLSIFTLFVSGTYFNLNSPAA
jgi:hypothetical protein